MKVYHYTKSFCLDIILEAGFIKLETILPSSSIPDLVWLTSEKFVPNICRRQDHTLSPARFVDVDYHRFIFDSSDPLIKRWASYQRTIRGGRESVATLHRTARDLKDNPRKWFVSEVPLPIGEHEEAIANPEFNFFVDGQLVNYFAP